MTTNDPKERLIILFEEAAQHTQRICQQGCRYENFHPTRCCDAMWCEMAISWAKEAWDVTLQTTGHPQLPLMGADGCTADPQFRPLCTIHQCYIEKWGFHPTDPEWTARYWELRDEINELSFKLFG